MLLTIALNNGINLEAELIEAHGTTQTTKLAIFLHPWSWLGGQMQDPVLSTLVEPFEDKAYAILRYNSRAVGGSTGRASFTGFSEVEDLQAVVAWACNRFPELTSLVIMGYSHGSLIASASGVTAPPRIRTSHVLLSYPLGPRHWLTAFRSRTYDAKLEELIRMKNSNVLLAHGDHDEFTGKEIYRGWCERLRGVGVEDRFRIVEVTGATHFWGGRSMVQLSAAIYEWLP